MSLSAGDSSKYCFHLDLQNSTSRWPRHHTLHHIIAPEHSVGHPSPEILRREML